MTFSCDRCHERFSTSEEPVPGRTYRVPCRCGNVILLSSDELDPFTMQIEPTRDDPFASAEPHGRAAPAPALEVTPTIIGPLARRDPGAPSDDSAEHRISGATSFDDVLQRVRRQGFLAGSATGAVAGALVAAVIAVVVWRSPPPTPAAVVPARVEPTRAPAAMPPSPAPSAAKTRRTGSATSASAAVPPSDAAAAAAPPSSEAAASGPEPAQPRADVQPLDEQELSAALRARRDALDACVSATPGDADPPRGQRFRLLVVIEPSGLVSDARIDDLQVEATPLGVCLVRIAEGMSFRPFDGDPVRVALPLRHGNSE